MKELKISIIAVLISFLAVTGGFAFILKNVHQDGLSKDLKISALINEVGDLKQTNDTLYQYSEKNSNKLKNIYLQLNILNKNFQAGLAEKDETIKEIASLQENLAATIKDKEQTIGALTQKNLALKDEVAADTYGDEILDILVIGQNTGLTDAMHLVSANPATGNISVISIPRDLYHNGRKINELFNLYGIEKLEEAVEQVTGITPDKYVIFDFDSFVSIIDSFGGVEINVEKDLIDNQYPGPNHTYKLITFKKGIHTMNGETALKYARSRKSTTDFDRSYRQQQVLESLVAKIRGLNMVQNLEKFMALYDGIKDKIKTDISIFEALSYFENYKDFKLKGGNVISNRNFLYNSLSKKGQYILLPINGSYADIKTYVADLVKK